MEMSEKKLVNTLREQFERLLIGEPAQPVDIDTSEDADVVSLAGVLNRFITEYNAVREFSTALASGNLEEAPLPRNLLASPFKQLHAALRHLTWQTERIAKGDYSQRVHFMGDFSNAFNSMVVTLEQSEAELQSANEELRVQGEELQEQSEELQAQNEELDAQNCELAQLWEKTVRAEQALQKANEELEIQVRERTTELLEKDRMLMVQSRQAAMGEMIGNIAHQWRQPLNALGLIIQSLSMMQATGELTKKDMSSMEEKAMQLIRHMSQTIDDFRNFFKTDKEKSSFKVNEVVRNTVSLIEANFREYKIIIEVNTEEGMMTRGFPREYAQAFLNILMNARDALLEKGPADPRVTVRAWMEGGRSVVTVSDNAGGIDAGIIGNIFDLYFTTKDNEMGTGIGLFISKNIIEKNMGGSLTVRNIGEGAEFRIEV